MLPLNLNILVAMPVSVTTSSFIPPDVVQQLEAIGKVNWNTMDRQYDPDELRKALMDNDICITGWGCCRFDENVLKGVDRLKLIAHTGGSVSPYVSDCLYDKGIKVISGNKLYAESVAEGVVGYILASLRKIPLYANAVQNGVWADGNSPTEGLLDQTVGLAGFGAVAKYLAGMLKVFRCRVKAYDPFVSEEICKQYGVEKVDTLEELFTSSKIISLHMPKIPSTYHIIDARLLSMIPDGALLVNSSRGSVVDEEAMAKELQKDRFMAILDVFEVEPLPLESGLRGLDNVILIPHMAGPTVDRRRMVTKALLDDIARFYDGLPMQHEIPKEYAIMMTQ